MVSAQNFPGVRGGEPSPPPTPWLRGGEPPLHAREGQRGGLSFWSGPGSGSARSASGSLVRWHTFQRVTPRTVLVSRARPATGLPRTSPKRMPSACGLGRWPSLVDSTKMACKVSVPAGLDSRALSAWVAVRPLLPSAAQRAAQPSIRAGRIVASLSTVLASVLVVHGSYPVAQWTARRTVAVQASNPPIGGGFGVGVGRPATWYARRIVNASAAIPPRPSRTWWSRSGMAKPSLSSGLSTVDRRRLSTTRRKVPPFRATLLPVQRKVGWSGTSTANLLAPRTRPERVVAVNAASKDDPPIAAPVAALSNKTKRDPPNAIDSRILLISSSLEG